MLVVTSVYDNDDDDDDGGRFTRTQPGTGSCYRQLVLRYMTSVKVFVAAVRVLIRGTLIRGERFSD